MVILAEIEYLDKFITIQQKNIRHYLFLSLGLVMIGFIVIVVGFFYPIDYLKLAFTLGGSFISSLGGLNIIKDIRTCKNKIDIYRSMKDSWSRLQTEADKDRFKEIVWKILEKGVVG